MDFFYYRVTGSQPHRTPVNPSKDTPPDTPPRMWTCTKCSYAYNPLWVELCDICESKRTPASLSQPSLITVTKEEKGQQLTKKSTRPDDKSSVTINKDGGVKFSASKSTHVFDEVATIVEVPMASFEQDLEDDITYVDDSSLTDTSNDWTCKKCTLVNSVQNKVCVVCGGSKLRSISSVEDMTLRKGEFWSCAQCTLKNSLSVSVCIACKTTRQVPVISGQQTNFRPYTSTPAPYNNNKTTAVHHPNRQVTTASAAASGTQGQSSGSSLAPPVHRVCRSPSPNKHASGAIPKVLILLID